MNRHVLEGNLFRFTGEMKEAWGKLTDDDIAKTQGQVEKLVGVLQEKYGIQKEEAIKQIDEFSSKLKQMIS